MFIWATVVHPFFYPPQATSPHRSHQTACQSSVSEMRHLQTGVCKDSVPDDGTTTGSSGDTQSTFHHHWRGLCWSLQGHTRKPVLIKSYISIFVCFSNKASHIEIISDLTTEAFLAGLKRFIARRGLSQEIHSDNGTNFLGAKNDLNDLYHFLQSTTTTSAVNKYLLSQRVQWQCIPKRASYFGGLWEVAVKAAKYHLRHVMGTQCLTYEEFATVTCQIESCLNSQPLTPITSHAIDGISALTTGHS